MSLKSALVLALYRVLTTLALIPGACYLAYHRRRDRHYGKDFWQLLGINLPTFAKRSVIFHAASMGEANAIKPLVAGFKKRHPEINTVVTTLTTTGAQSANKIADIKVCYSPLDNYFAIKSFYKKLKPSMIVTADTELWPEKLVSGNKAGCKMVLVNARMQEKNTKAYLKHKDLVADLMASKLDKVLCASDDDAKRYERIGVAPQKITVTGNLKYDLKKDPERFALGTQIKNKLSGPVLGAISTHASEEVLIIKCYEELKKSIEKLSLILVPRHKEGVSLAKAYLEEHKLPYIIKSNKGIEDAEAFNGGILIGDTMGEIALYFGMCDIVFMGGSFTTTGGHNPLEPACHKLASITGPDFHNFKGEYAGLIERGGAFKVTTTHELISKCTQMLGDLRLCKEAGLKAYNELQSGKGAVERTLDELDKLLS